MNHQIKQLLANDRFATYVGLELVKIQPGYALVKLEIADKHLNGVNMIQGGAIFTLADFAFAAAANAGGQVTVGINANVAYYKGSKGNTLIAEAQEMSVSKTIVHYKVNIVNEHQEDIAQVNFVGFKKQDRMDEEKKTLGGFDKQS